MCGCVCGGCEGVDMRACGCGGEKGREEGGLDRTVKSGWT